MLALALSLAPTFLQEPVQLEMYLTRGVDQVPLAENEPLVLGETVVCTIDLRINPQYLEEHVVPRWRRPMDLQFELTTPWLNGASGMQLLESTPPWEGSLATLVIDREPGSLWVMAAQDGTRNFRLQRHLLITAEDWSLDAASVQWTAADAFAEDLVRGRIAVDPQEQTQSSPSLMGKAQPLNSFGRPEFLGAVGVFHTSLTLHEAAADGSTTGNWDFRGFGYLDRTMLPDPANGDGFHVRAQRLEELADGLRLHLELMPKSGAAQLEFPRWEAYDPVRQGFGTLVLPRVQLANILEQQTYQAMAMRDSVEKEPEPQPEVTEEREVEGVQPLAETELPAWIVPLILGGSLMIGVILILIARRESPEETLSKLAASIEEKPKLAALAPKSPADFFDHLADFLEIPRDALYGDNFAARLAASGIKEEQQSKVRTVVAQQRRALFAEEGEVPSEESLQQLWTEIITTQ